ncbi:unnamed protein product [Ambrosiozyma monospora]|uniref:Unnamed protein product n=1 Tax=Ambrosiozyma monospora TaxID=43982 RepID=A0ACB5TAL6_AMBMO|nr:unnamed protein product [Ambrosiozyma monospora]
MLAFIVPIDLSVRQVCLQRWMKRKGCFTSHTFVILLIPTAAPRLLRWLNKSIELENQQSANLDGIEEREQSYGDELNVGSDNNYTNNPELQVQARPRLLASFHYTVSHVATDQHMTASTLTNGETTHEEEVQIQVEEDEYDYNSNHDPRANSI